MTGPAEPDDPLIGRRLEHFILKARLAASSGGAVYRAEQVLLGREAAVKVLDGGQAPSASAVKRFLREAQLASRFDHPYAAHLYAFGAEPDGLLWIAMELVHGTTLADLVRDDGPLPLERFVPFFDRTCEVVHAAHEQGIVHRDLKPRNIMVISRAGRLLPKLLDFGIAKAMTESADGDRPESAGGADDSAERGPSLDELLEAAPSSATSAGQVVGSPAYMAPEQWVNARFADARTDLYALGVLAFEAVTGKPPFTGDTVGVIAGKHLRRPVPPLGEGFPAALDGVFARAMAKRPSDRYQTALELAGAFRVGSGLTLDRASIPQLEPALRETFTTSAPQPLAEAIAQLEAARNVHQARDGLNQVVRIAVEYVGLLALACRASAGPGRVGDAAPVIDALGQLRRRALTPAEWLGLVRELVRPFAANPDRYPIRELVGLCFDPDGAELDERGPFAPLVAELALDETAGAASEDQALDVLSRRLPFLAALLRALAFLTEYPLVVVKHGAAERFMGLRRPRRPPVPLRGPPLAADRPAIIDGNDTPVVMLWPLVQLCAPAPGLGDELFLFRGPGRHGAKLVAAPASLEHEDPAVWDWFRERLAEGHGAADAADAAEQAPYRGLASFTANDAHVFFGREQEAEAFVNQLHRVALCTLVGPSGAGKSSFLQAGVVPALPDHWVVVTMRPGRAPVAALAARLATIGIGSSDAAAVRAAAEARGMVVVVVVDQLEELFTLCADPAERAAFADGVMALARSADDPIRVVLSIRDDFLVRTQELDRLRGGVIAQALTVLTAPPPGELRRILCEPARRAGYDFDDRELPDEMVREVANHSGALALLSFTAAELWDRRDRPFKQITRRAYDALGGVAGALAQHAEETLGTMTGQHQQLVRIAFRHLVTAEGTRAVLGHAELLQILGPAGEPVVERLIAARMLVASEGEDGEERVEIIHEALLAAWPRLGEWRRQDADGSRLRDQLRTAARLWHDRSRPAGLLWRGEALAEYQLWRTRQPGALPEREEAFAAASLSDAARGRRVRAAIAATVGVVLTVAIIALLLINRRAETQRSLALASSAESQRSAAESHARVIELYQEEGRQALLGGDPSRALVFLAAAYTEGAHGPGLAFLIGSATRAFDAEVARLPGHTRGITHLAYSPDGTRVCTTSVDGKLLIWDATTARLIHEIVPAEKESVYDAGFSPDGARLVSGQTDGTVRIWDVATGAQLLSIAAHVDRVMKVGFSRDGARVISVGFESKTEFGTRVSDATTGAQLHAWRDVGKDGGFGFVISPDGERVATLVPGKRLSVHDTRSGATLVAAATTDTLLIAMSPAGDLVLTSSLRGTRVWDVARGAAIATFELQANITTAQFSPDGTRIVSAGWDHDAKVWMARTGAFVTSLEGHTGIIRTVVFSPDGSRVASAGDDGTAKLWEADSGTLLASFLADDDLVVEAAFDPAGTHLVTGGTSGSVRIFIARSSHFLAKLVGHTDNIWSVRFSADGTRIVSASADRTARVWDAATGALQLAIEHEDQLNCAAFSPDGTRIVTVAGNVHVWDAVDGHAILSLVGHDDQAVCASFSPDGARIVSASVDATVRTWDARTGAQQLVLRGHNGMVSNAEFSPDGRLIVSAGHDAKARVWDATTGAVIHTLASRLDVFNAAFSSDGSRIATASADRSARIWDTATGELQLTLPHPAGVGRAVFSTDGAFILTAGHDGLARIWEAATGKLLGTLGPHAGPVTWAQFSPDGARVATTSTDRKVMLWDVRLDDRTPAAVDAFVRCRIPMRLDGGRVVPGTIDATACATPP